MISKILNKALSLIIPQFVENFDKKTFDNLNKNQKIVQSDLLFKPDSFFYIGLPFLIDSGSIKEFSISIDQNNSVLINISNAEISCTISRVPESNNKNSINSLKNKIIKKCISNINFSFIFTNLIIHVNTIFDFHIPTLNFDSISKPTTKDEKANNFISLIITANNLSYKIRSKSVLDSSFTLTINLPFGNNHEKQILLKTNEVNINFSQEIIPFFVSFIKTVFNCSSTLQSSEFITLSILDEDNNNNNSTTPLNEIDDEEEEDKNKIEINFGDMAKWAFNFDINLISIQIEEETKIMISKFDVRNDFFSISKFSILNSLNDQVFNTNSIQYSLSFIDIIFDNKEKKLTIQKIIEETNEFLSFIQKNQKNNFLTTKKNENENKLDFFIDELEYKGSFELLLNWILIQFRTIDLFYSILNEFASNDQNEIDSNSSSAFTETTEIYDYSNESSAEINQALSSSNSKTINPTIISELLKKLISKSVSIGVTFPHIELNFNSGFSSQLGIHLFFSLKKRSYQIFGSDCHLSFKKFEPIASKLSFQISVQKNLINVLLSPSDFRFTEDEGMLMFYNVVNQLKKLFDQIQSIENKRRILRKKVSIVSMKKRLKMTIVTFNLILCKNVFIQKNEFDNDDTKNCCCYKKNSFLMISSDDISLSASSLRDKISLNFKCLPSLRFWNSKTSYWDYVVNPFHLDVSVVYKNGIVHFDASIPSSLEFNITPFLVDCLLPKCSENYAGIDLSKLSLTNLTLNNLKKQTSEILQKYKSNKNSTEAINSTNNSNSNENSNNNNNSSEVTHITSSNENPNKNSSEITSNSNSNKNSCEKNNINNGDGGGGDIDCCYGSESVSIYNGFGFSIPIAVVNDFKTSRTSSAPSFFKLKDTKEDNDNNNDDSNNGNLHLSSNTVTAEEHRKITQFKKDCNSSVILQNDLNSSDNNLNHQQMKMNEENNETIILENLETKLIPNATINSIVSFPSFNESIKITNVKCDFIIHNEMVIVPSFRKESDPKYGKLIKLLPRFEIHNMTKYPLEILLLENGETEIFSNYNAFTINSNGKIPLNEIQCRKKIILADEKSDLSNLSNYLNSFNSNLNDKRSNYFLMKLYSSSNDNKKNIKKENEINHPNEDIFRTNLLMSLNCFLFSTIPNVYNFVSQNSIVNKWFSFKLTNPISPLNQVLEIRPLFAVKNDLPFDVICTFLSDLKNCVSTVSVGPQERVDLDDFNSNSVGIQFTACVVPLGISKTIVTSLSKDSSLFESSSQKVTPFTQILEKEMIVIRPKKNEKDILLSFCMTFNYCELTGQFVFYLYSPIVIVNKTEICPLYINDGQNIYEFSKSNFPINEEENEKIFPTFILNSSFLNSETSLSISTQEEGPFVLLPQMSQFLNIFAGKDVIYPFYIEYRKMNEFVSYYEIRPRLSIINKMPFELKFTMKAKLQNKSVKQNEPINDDSPHLCFVVGLNEEKTVKKCRNDISFSVQPPNFHSIDEFIMQTPMSTVFRFTNEDDEEEVVHFQLDSNDSNHCIGFVYRSFVHESFYLAIFEPASIWMPCPTMFVIVNNIPNFPIHAQQCEESMPIRISPNSTSMFPFDSPFSNPVVMITIAGKSQLVPLQNEIKATLFPFKLGSEKIYADLIVLSSFNDTKKHNKSVQALIIGYQPYHFSSGLKNEGEKNSFVFNQFIKTYNFSFNFIVKELCLSFFDEKLEEFILASAKLIKTELKSNQVNFSIDSLQIDDQISFVKDTVVFKSKSSTTDSNLQKAMKEMRSNSLSQISELNASTNANISMNLNSNSNSNLLQRSNSSLNVGDDESMNENENIDELNDKIYSNSKLDWSLSLKSKSFFQLSIMFDFSLINAQSLELLVQPFDIVIDPTFVHDFLVYFSRLFDGRKFIIPDTLVYFQDFIMYPMSAHVLCKEIQKRKIHFNSILEGNDNHLNLHKLIENNCEEYFDHKITIGENLASSMRSFLLSNFKPEKKCFVAFNSLVCHDLNMRLSTFLDILSRHLGFFAKNALSYLSGSIYTEKPEVSFSLFQSSFVVSEFYNINNVNELKGKSFNNSPNFSSYDIANLDKDFDSVFGVSSYLDTVIRIKNLHPTDVFPVFSCSSNIIIEYKTHYLIVQESSSLLSTSSSAASSATSSNQAITINSNRVNSNIDSNSNLDLFSLSSSLSNYHFSLGNRNAPQKLLVMNKVQFLTAEMVGIETLIKKSISNQNEKNKLEKINFIDYCGSMSTVIAVTENFLFVYALPSFNLVSRFLISSIADVKVNKNRIIIQLKRLSKWKSNDPVILVDLIDDDIAMQLKLVIQTLLAKQNKFV